MAKSRSSNRSSVRVRDTSRIASSIFQPELPLVLPRTPLNLIEDRRTFHPDGPQRNARSFRTGFHLLVSPKPSPSMLMQSPNFVSHGVQFHAPEKVLVCVRRKTRREVIHALGKAGKGVARRHPRRSHYSDVKC